MNSNLPVDPSGNSWITEWLAQGKIPGAAKAIAHLIGSAADAASAWVNIAKAKGRQVEQAIDDETKARSVLYKALSKVAADTGSKDPALIDRTIERLAGKNLKQQINREEVARRTIKIIEEGDTVDPSVPPPEEDWLNYFSSHAEQASSERLQKTWARVLAGEIRRPGSFSFRTLQFISLLDKEIAHTIEEFSVEVCNGTILPYPDRFGFTSFFAKITALRECGILHDDLIARIELVKGNVMRIQMSNEFIVDFMCDDSGPYELEHCPMTQVGKEIYAILHPRPTLESARQLARAGLRSGRFSYSNILAATRQSGSITGYAQVDRLDR